MCQNFTKTIVSLLAGPSTMACNKILETCIMYESWPQAISLLKVHKLRKISSDQLLRAMQTMGV